MPAIEELSVFLNLQQTVLDTKDEESLLRTLLKSALEELPKIGLSFSLITAVFFDSRGKPQANYTTNKQGFDNLRIKPGFLNANENIKQKLLLNLLAVSNSPQLFFETPQNNIFEIKSVICSPIRVTGTFAGILLLASEKNIVGIPKTEDELIKIFTNYVALAYRLQDTQASLTNITKEVYEMNAKLHQLDKLKDDFVSVASHELRTPMTAIKSYLWVAMNKKGDQLSEDMKRYLSRAYISVERLINLVNDMLNISRIESGRIALKLSAVNLNELVNEVTEEVTVKAREKGLHVIGLNKQIPKVFADRDKIHEVLLNLIGNSLKFTKTGGTITVDFYEKYPYVFCAVRDTGVGIAPENLSRLFAKFGRLENSYVAVAESGVTGLGLYISKSIVNLHKGQITAESPGLGNGTTFTFSLPIIGTNIAQKLKDEAPKETEETKDLEKTSVNFV